VLTYHKLGFVLIFCSHIMATAQYLSLAIGIFYLHSASSNMHVSTLLRNLSSRQSLTTYNLQHKIHTSVFDSNITVTMPILIKVVHLRTAIQISASATCSHITDTMPRVIRVIHVRSRGLSMRINNPTPSSPYLCK